MIIINIVLNFIMKKRLLKFVKSVVGGIKDGVPLITTVKHAFVKKQTENAVVHKIDWIRLITNLATVGLILYLLDKGFDVGIIKEVLEILKP